MENGLAILITMAGTAIGKRILSFLLIGPAEYLPVFLKVSTAKLPKDPARPRHRLEESSSLSDMNY